MSIAKVQSTSKTAANVTSTTLAYTANVTAGNLLVAFWACFSPSSGVGHVQAPTDTKGNTWTQVTAISNADSETSCQMFYAIANGSGADTLTFTVSGAASGFLFCAIAEFSGIVAASPLDKTAAGTGSGTAVSSGSTAALAQADELVLGGMCWSGTSTTATETGGATLIAESEDNATVQAGSFTFKVVAATTAVSATWTIGATQAWAAHVGTFKAAATGTNAPAGNTAGTGTSQQPIASIGAQPPASSSTGTAPTPNTTVKPPATGAAGTGTAPNAAVLTGAIANAGVAAGTGTATPEGLTGTP